MLFNHFEKLGEEFGQKVFPTPLKNQRMVAFSEEAAQLIDLDLLDLQSEEFLQKISGKQPDRNFSYIAQAYAGHQFGHFVDILGDGRTILLTQIKNKKNQSWDLVLKGSGLTPFSRPYVLNADGRAVLRSSIREFLISEAMFHLGIPTSRALCLITSDDVVQREKLEPAAQIIRLSPSHLRFGTFEYFFYRKQNNQVKILADYAIKEYFLQIKTYSEFFRNIVKSTAIMIAKWQAFGFCHGVMNTDNMSIHGITFDYGPFGFLDEYNPHHICNHSDHAGRYSFINQPFSAFWNLNALGVTLSSLISMDEQKEILQDYEKNFLEEYHKLMAAKLGFDRADDNSKKLTYEILDLLEKHKIDYTIFFRNLENTDFILNLSPNEGWKKDFKNWLSFYKPNAPHLIKKSNPKFILRNYLLQNAIEKAEAGDFSEVKKLQEIIKKPFEEQQENEKYSSLPPSWAKEIHISCSS